MKRKSGFTLVEMLIVVVIIGILSAALIPRLTGYMARTRDLKRHADLRDIAAAITMYKNDHGEFPTREVNDPSFSTSYAIYFGSVSDIIGVVPAYLNQFPHDPSSNMIKIHVNPMFGNEGDTSMWRYWGKNWGGGVALMPGEYLYQIMRNGGMSYGSAVLVAKVETPDMANFVLDTRLEKYTGWKRFGDNDYYTRGGFRNDVLLNNNVRDYPGMDINYLYLCENVDKSPNNNIISATKDNKKCQYTSEDQLYYIVKIE